MAQERRERQIMESKREPPKGRGKAEESNEKGKQRRGKRSRDKSYRSKIARNHAKAKVSDHPGEGGDHVRKNRVETGALL